jgi:uncharacterized protein YegJ (DUF2314 family)
MKIQTLFILLVGAMLAGILISCSDSSSADRTINVEEDDADMKSAIAKARESLPRFWESFEHPQPGETDFALKVKITDPHGTEHFWASNLERKDGKIMGTIDNDPNIVHRVKMGDRITIPEEDISDWAYLRNEKIVGNYTLRVLFKHMSAKEAAKYKRMLADPDLK